MHGICEGLVECGLPCTRMSFANPNTQYVLGLANDIRTRTATNIRTHSANEMQASLIHGIAFATNNS